MSRLAIETGRSLGDFSNEWWDEAIDRLARRADKKLQRKTWLGLNGGVPPAAAEGVDFVLTVLEKSLTRERNWDPDVHPDLYRWLSDQVDSEISNLATSSKNKRTVRISADGEAPEPGRYWNENLHHSNGPEELALEKEATDRVWRFAESLDDEPELQAVVIAGLDGAATRSEIAQMLKVSEEEIDKRRKRLKRRRRDFVYKKPVNDPRGKGETGRV